MAKTSSHGRAGGYGEKFSAIQLDEFVDYRSIAEPLLPLEEASVTQLKPGAPPSNLGIFASASVSVLSMQHNAASVGVTVVKPHCYSFMWWDGVEECRINGKATHRGVLYAQGAHDGFYAAGGRRRTEGVAVRRDEFSETIAALCGVGVEDVDLGRSDLALAPDAATRLRVGIQRVVADAAKIGAASHSRASAMILGALVEAYMRAAPEQSRDERGRPPEQIVRQAEDRFFAAEGGKVSLADLCAAAKVSQRALYRAFHSVCGEPPLAYFQKRRLADARRILQASHPSRGAVMRAARSVGLTEMGRFSVEYRRMFGESPSSTLNRTQGI